MFLLYSYDMYCMARLLTTNDPYTSWTSYDLINSVMSWSVYDPSHTSYNITVRDQPFCFFHSWLSEITLKDNSGPFTIDLSSSLDNFVCTSTPLIWQSTELIILDGETSLIKVAPDSVINALYRLPVSPVSSGDIILENDQSAIDAFCEISATPSDEEFICEYPFLTAKDFTGSLEGMDWAIQNFSLVYLISIVALSALVILALRLFIRITR